MRKIVSTAADPHFDSLQYIHSSGAWDPTGKRFAIAALSSGEPVLTILDIDRPSAREDIRLGDLGEIYNPSWSPDGTRIVFSALKGGLSDLFVYTFATERAAAAHGGRVRRSAAGVVAGRPDDCARHRSLLDRRSTT